MIIGRILRVAAVAIAIAAALDPPLTIGARGRPRIAVVVQDPARDEMRATADRVVSMLRPEFDVAAGPDATADAIVSIGAEYFGAVPNQQRAYTVTLAPRSGERILEVTALRAPRAVPPGTLIHIDVDVAGRNLAGTTSTLNVRAGDGAVAVGQATHTWTSVAERWQAAMDVTPIGPPPWRLHIEASPAAGERRLADNRADAMVDVSAPLRVLVYEARPSWASTFVRRALEADRRFDVASVTQASRGVIVTAGESDARQPGRRDGLRQTALDGFQAVVAGGLDRISREEVGVLREFMRGREGAVVLLPDSRADLRALGESLPIPDASTVLLEQPARLSVDGPLPPFEASEMLTFAAGPEARIVAATGEHRPVVTIAPVGAGRLLVSGALDAWRYRADDNAAFDRFWQAAVAGVAAATPPVVEVTIVPPVVAPGADADVRVRVRGAADTVSAALANGDPIRLWPDVEPGTYRGSFVAPRLAGAGRVTTTAGSVTGTSRFVVSPGAREARGQGVPLPLLASSHRGFDVGPDGLPALARRIRQDIAAPPVQMTEHPMRSAWWMIPFAACLGGEWWFRRRRGLR